MSKHTAQKKNPLLDNSYWHYFLQLESDVYASAQYIACIEANDATCSIEFAKQIVCICTECEAVLKKICKFIDPKNNPVNMGHYKRTLLDRFPEIHKAPVHLGQRERTIHPFAEWNNPGGRIDWWNAYQDVKYHRDSNFEKASLKNTLDALGALLILELTLYAGISSNGTEALGGTKLLWAPGMPRSETVPSEEALPHLKSQ
ncbi:MAG: hypothetical protein PF495_17565 [Spirochaetales bacterium]|jgi:hypothetical protein|nr:hypothetical protein [Spirochaetales bacterium]